MRAIRSLGSLLLLAVLPPFQGGDRPDRPDRPDRDPPSRVGVDSTGDTTSVTVRRGEAEVTASGSAFPVHPEQTAMVVGGDSPTYDVRDAIRSDDWEDWCASRDRRWDDARSSRYVSRDVI